MNPETLKRLVPKFNRVMELHRITGSQSYEEAMATLKEEVQDKNTSPAPWLHKKAREIYPTDSPDTVNPELFYGILSQIDTTEKATAIFAALPEESAPEIETFLDFMVKEYFPASRENAEFIAAHVPQRPGTGRRPTMPSDDKCRAIYSEIEELAIKDVKRGSAQRRVAAKYGLSWRIVQRICAAQKKRIASSQPDAIDPE